LSRATILLIDDDPEIQTLLETVLTPTYALFHVDNLKNARDFINRSVPDLILLDDELPDGRGIEMFNNLKSVEGARQTPILMLTKKGAVENKVAAFELGAEDYITKPFEPLEVLARVQLRLKHKRSDSSSAPSTRFDDLELDVPMSKAYLHAGESKNEIDMTPIEFKILYLLASKKGEVLSRKDILSEVWGDSQHVIERTVDQHVSKIRKKLQECSYTVRSAHGRGYAFVKNI
tara:strand:- start:8318 stop:9016 length:699 start_codon:yes stop_codon:yes gene_type:complete